MTTKEMSRQMRMLDTKYNNIKKLVNDLGMESEAEDNIADILSAQMLVHRKQIVEGVALFDVKGADDLSVVPIAKVGGL